MAIYSEEYCVNNGLQIAPEFSIATEFQKLKEDSSKQIICEGLGITRIINRNDGCYLLLTDGSEISYEKLTGKLIKKDNYRIMILIFIFMAIALWLFTTLHIH